MKWTVDDYQFMSRALHLAKNGRYTCAPNPGVGCVIVKENYIIGEGWHALAGSAHAEINALSDGVDASGASVYTTLEPCSYQGRTAACTAALIEADVFEVIIAMTDPNPRVSGMGVRQLKNAGIRVRQGLLEDEARKLNPGFIKRMTKGLPYMRCKMAMSVDAKTALVNGKSHWISNEKSRQDVHRKRAASDAILSSADSVIKDEASLTVRDIAFAYKPPIRIVVDRHLKLHAQLKLFQQPGQVVIYTQSVEPSGLDTVDAKIIVINPTDNWLGKVLTHMAKEMCINEVLVEAGSTLSGALIAAGLVDELIIYIAPVLFGRGAYPLVQLDPVLNIEDAQRLTLTDVLQIDQDLRLSYTLSNH